MHDHELAIFRRWGSRSFLRQKAGRTEKIKNITGGPSECSTGGRGEGDFKASGQYAPPGVKTRSGREGPGVEGSSRAELIRADGTSHSDKKAGYQQDFKGTERGGSVVIIQCKERLAERDEGGTEAHYRLILRWGSQSDERGRLLVGGVNKNSGTPQEIERSGQ